MERKYELLKDETIDFYGKTLYRIRATESFGDVCEDEKGGFIEGYNNLDGDAWVSGDAKVCGNAMVGGNAQVTGNAMVGGIAYESGEFDVANMILPVALKIADALGVNAKNFYKFECYNYEE